MDVEGSLLYKSSSECVKSVYPKIEKIAGFQTSDFQDLLSVRNKNWSALVGRKERGGEKSNKTLRMGDKFGGLWDMLGSCG